ncbi:MAG TPA: DUF6538 domain-containing protein, partial [Stellaceae bacterium]|nr:DUF6538 domain-containing protein [Stellaceae bacterium]
MQLVNDIWRVRVVVPDEFVPIIGKATLTRSTGTGNEREANRLAPPIIAEFHAMVDEAEAKLTGRQTFRQTVEAEAATILAFHDDKVAEAKAFLAQAERLRTAVTVKIDALRL